MAKIYFRYGAMNCGKTTSLLQVAHNYEEYGFRVCVIKPSQDKKGAKNIVSRLGVEREVDVLLNSKDNILELLNLKNIDCILVDEVQFINRDQVIELWTISKIYDIPVICYGLKTNFKAELFSGSAELIAIADELEELSTICSCGKRARFNARLVNGEYVLEGKEIAIDGIDAQYEPLCGDCYLKYVLKKY